MKIFIGSLIMIGVLYGVVYFLDFIGVLDIPNSQYSATAAQTTEKPKMTKEETFAQPINVAWGGEVFGVLQSGNGYAIRSLSETAKYPEFQAYWPDDKIEWLSGDVEVSGTFDGISCAYQNTVFNGNCVPILTIRSVEPIKE